MFFVFLLCLCAWQLEALSSSKETIEKLQRKLENAEAVISMKSESERLVHLHTARKSFDDCMNALHTLCDSL